jgi:hypothetical protein
VGFRRNLTQLFHPKETIAKKSSSQRAAFTISIHTLSVILEASLETCVHRVLVIRKDNYFEADVKRHYNNFHQILKHIF